MAAIADIIGKIHITFPGYEPVLLGTVRVPLVVTTSTPTHAGEAAYRISADLKTVTETIQAIFAIQEEES